MQPFNDIWNLVLKELAEKHTQSATDLWFSSLILYDFTDSLAVLICDMPFKYKILKSKYIDSIAEAIEAATGLRVEVIIVEKTSDPIEYAKYVGTVGDVPEPVNLAELPQTPPESEEGGGKDGNTQKAAPPHNYQNEYTFENFIVGSSNNLAHAASVAVANDPSCKSNEDNYTFNPLFIYGPSGLGKTHLLYAIINRIRERQPDLKIVYVKGEEFTNQLIDSISKKTPEQFREKYRKADVLLIDDVQFIAGRDSTQEEFFHTFNALYEDHKQIILTSDRPPKDIKTLEDRLKTRFEWGITADIQPPDADLRAAILKKKAAAMNITISNDVVNFLAEHLKSNIRQVEGAIKKLGALSLLTGTPITIELAKNSIADLMTTGEPVSVTIDRILEKVAKKYGIAVEDLKGNKRTKEIAYARHIAIYLLRKLTDMSYPQIGKLLKRDHSTIISSLRTVEEKMGANTPTNNEVTELIKELKS